MTTFTIERKNGARCKFEMEYTNTELQRDSLKLTPYPNFCKLERMIDSVLIIG